MHLPGCCRYSEEMALDGDGWLTNALSQPRSAPPRNIDSPRTASAPPAAPYHSLFYVIEPMAAAGSTSYIMHHFQHQETRFSPGETGPSPHQEAHHTPDTPEVITRAQSRIGPVSRIKRIMDLIAVLRAELGILFRTMDTQRENILRTFGPNRAEGVRDREETLLRMTTAVNAALGECVTMIGREVARLVASERGGVRLWVR